ncbi:MAG: putative metal-binding motif-containing protein, partial [Deltaproteobacteria bacterium]|nr:putative metal-binding motif-containing protein [Deltaproteobacteria bacterium]
MTGRLLRLLPVAATLAAAAGCSDNDATSDGDVADTPDDGSPDEGGADEAGGACTTDEECWDDLFCNGAERCAAGECVAGRNPCDDGIDCTRDVCSETASPRCSYEPDDAACRNGVACDGDERCVLGWGCTSSEPPDCNDDDPCTLDRCEETAGGCVHEPRDLDGDTYATTEYGCDAFGGDDCDDRDEAVHPGAVEACDDGRDNDCDGLTDLDDVIDCHAENDRCDGAIPLADGGRTVGSLFGTSDDYEPACGERLPEAVYSFTLATTRNVTLGVDSPAPGASLAAELQTVCGDPATALRCSSYGPPMTLRFYALPAGTYYVPVRGESWIDELFVDYATAAPTPAPPGDTCADAPPLVPGTTTTGSLTEMNDDYRPGCFPTGGPDVFYRVVLTEPHAVAIHARFTVSGPPLG